MSETLIKVENVSKKFCRDLKRSLYYGLTDMGREMMGMDTSGMDSLRKKEFWAVDDVSFEVKRGESIGLIGHNGAGKSTLLKMLNGLIKPDKGRIEMRGRIGALIELGAGFNPVLTGRENVYINASVLGLTKKETDDLFDQIVDFAELHDFIDTPVQYYSSGMKVRLGFSVASQLKPDILLLDEVLAVGDEFFKKKCFDFLYKIQNTGTSFILVSHNPYAVERMCSEVLVLNRGKIVAIDEAKKAIYYYHKLLTRGETESLVGKPEKSDSLLRDGTGQIRIKQVTLRNNQGKEISTLSTGDLCSFFIDFEVKEVIEGPRFKIEINSTSEVNLLTFVTFGVFEKKLFQIGYYRIKLSISQMNLFTDKYNVNIKVGRNVNLDTFNNALSFDVILQNEKIINLTGGHGVIYCEATWDDNIQVL